MVPAPAPPPPVDDADSYADYWPGQGQWVTGMRIPLSRERDWEEGLHTDLHPNERPEVVAAQESREWSCEFSLSWGRETRASASFSGSTEQTSKVPDRASLAPEV